MNDNKLPVRLRTLTEEDSPFIFNSWLKSYRFSHFGEKITNTIYFEDHHKVMKKVSLSSILFMLSTPLEIWD